MENQKVNLSLIIEGCLVGNPLSQRKLYELFYGYGISIALQFAKHRTEAEEIFNDSFVNVFNNIEKFDTTYPFKPWVRRIIINSAIDHHRKYKKFNSTYSTENVPERKDDEVVFDFDEQVDLLPIIQKLPPAYRMVFTLYILEEYTHPEIAQMLDISVGTSKSNLFRAKGKLKELWIKENGSPKKNNRYG